MVDELAERSLMVDGSPLVDPAAYLPTSSIIASNGTLTMHAMITDALGNHYTQFARCTPMPPLRPTRTTSERRTSIPDSCKSTRSSAGS
jgi:hypothetical protein